ncbi:MAG: hypothetical protein Q4C70_09140 [Planctomycetia bacterium]|nr:hypothetical protein [Planctomycetia bacterium]
MWKSRPTRFGNVTVFVGLGETYFAKMVSPTSVTTLRVASSARQGGILRNEFIL